MVSTTMDVLLIKLWILLHGVQQRLLTEFINLDRENGASAVHHVP